MKILNAQNQSLHVIQIAVIMMALLMPVNNLANEQNGKTRMECYKKALECDFSLVKGGFFRAIQAVYENDFKKRLKNKGNSNLDKYISNLDNYDIYIELHDDRYLIGIGATMRPGAPDVFGYYHYEVDAKTYKLLKTSVSK